MSCVLSVPSHHRQVKRVNGLIDNTDTVFVADFADLMTMAELSTNALLRTSETNTVWSQWPSNPRDRHWSCPWNGGIIRLVLLVRVVTAPR